VQAELKVVALRKQNPSTSAREASTPDLGASLKSLVKATCDPASGSESNFEATW
jgi:hypothetical protein